MQQTNGTHDSRRAANAVGRTIVSTTGAETASATCAAWSCSRSDLTVAAAIGMPGIWFVHQGLGAGTHPGQMSVGVVVWITLGVRGEVRLRCAPQETRAKICGGSRSAVSDPRRRTRRWSSAQPTKYIGAEA